MVLEYKFDCLIYEMLLIKDIKPHLNTQTDSIRTKHNILIGQK